MTHPGSPTAFESLVDDYDAARPTYPPALYAALGQLGNALELGAGTGIASAALPAQRLVVTDLGPKMLARGLTKHSWPGVVCRAEELPFRDSTFDAVCGAQMWHWTTLPDAALEVVRVLRPEGRLLLWWNEVRADGLDWFGRQQDRLEAGNPHYGRGYREIDYGALLAPWLVADEPELIVWERTLSLELYGRWLRSKSYVQALPDVDSFVAACLDDLHEAFPYGQVVEPFRTRLWRFRARPAHP